MIGKTNIKLPSWILRRRKQHILIKLDIDLEHSPHLNVGDFRCGQMDRTGPKSSIKFLPIYYKCIRACVYVLFFKMMRLKMRFMQINAK